MLAKQKQLSLRKIILHQIPMEINTYYKEKRFVMAI